MLSMHSTKAGFLIGRKMDGKKATKKIRLKIWIYGSIYFALWNAIKCHFIKLKDMPMIQLIIGVIN